MSRNRGFSVDFQFLDNGLPIIRTFTVQKNSHIISERSSFVVYEVRTVNNDAIGNERSADDRCFSVSVKRFSKHFKLQFATKAGLVISECFPAIAGKGNKNSTHKLSRIGINHTRLS